MKKHINTILTADEEKLLIDIFDHVGYSDDEAKTMYSLRKKFQL